MARLRPDLPLVSVSLLQQTPMDLPLGDVLLANPGMCRLMEFKRAGRLTRKEKKKLAALRYGLEHSPVREEAEALSRRIHWYIEIQEPRMLGQALVTNVCSYLDFAIDADFITIGDFADHTAEQACQRRAGH